MTIINLKNKELYQTQAFINRQWENSRSGNMFSVTNPANDLIVAKVADCGAYETEKAIQAASITFNAWSTLTAKERAGFLKKWFALINENANDLALIMTTEQGKPLTE